MPKVTNPSPDGAIKSKNNHTFEWDMENVYYTSSKIIVGSYRGSDNIYAGKEFQRGTTKDNNVPHPGGMKKCYARVKYRKSQTGPWCTDGSQIREFFSGN